MTSLIENGMSIQATAAKASRRKIAGISAIARPEINISDTLLRAGNIAFLVFQLDPRSHLSGCRTAFCKA